LTEFVKYRLPGKSIVHVSGEFQPWNGQEKGFLVADFLVKHPLILVPNDHHEQFDFQFSNETPYQTLQEEYIDQAQRIHQEISYGNCKKVVLSRTKSVSYDTNFLFTDFERLCDLYPSAFVYIASSVKYGTWIGATPELLIEHKGDHYQTVALAATKKKDDTTPWTDKEYFEQGVVNEFIVQRLRKLGCEMIYSNNRHEVVAGPLKHLRNEITFKSPLMPLERIVQSLHPTPAVSGFPQDKAIEVIEKVEQHARSLYAGVIGVLDEQSSALFVNLRCAQVFENEVFLYVGGGHTEASDSIEEWQETENKAKTLLNVLQNH
jgi:isochorismate synthase